MASFQRMRLMRDEEYERLRAKQLSSYDPELRVLARLEDERRNVLDSPKLNDSEKVALMNHLNSRMLDVRSHGRLEREVSGITRKDPAEGLTKPLGTEAAQVGTVAIAPAPRGDAEAAPVDDAFDKRAGLMLAKVPARLQPQAAELLELIKANPDKLSLNNDYELVSRGNTVPDSNFLQLFDSLYSGSTLLKLKKLKGIEEFVSGLKFLKNARKLITNPYYTDQLGGNTLGKQLGNGSRKRKIKFPPGLTNKPLLVYPLTM